MRKSNYGIIEIIKNTIFVFMSKIIVPKARMIRFPVVIRGKKYIDFGEKITTGYRVRFEVNGKHSKKVLIFGKNVNMGDDCRFACANKIIIGNNVLIGSRVSIIDNSHGCYSEESIDVLDIPPNSRKIMSAPVIIEDNVWIGDGVVIQKGVTVGYGAIVGANSVVTKDVPPKCLVGGVPARVISTLIESEGPITVSNYEKID